jgi:hypothetical protein
MKTIKIIKYQKDQKYYTKTKDQSSYSDNLSESPFLRPSYLSTRKSKIYVLRLSRELAKGTRIHKISHNFEI